MRDYHVLSMDAVGGKVTDHGVALDIKDVPWAGRQMWAPDAAEKDGKYFLYFPVKDKQDVFRIGAAVSDKPAGPFKAEPQAIEGSYSMDPAVFKDTDGKYYMYFGGIWGGQLQRWATGHLRREGRLPAERSARADAEGRADARRHARLLGEAARRRHPRRAGQAADGRRQQAALLRGVVDAQVPRQVLLLVLDRRHALHRLRDRRLARTVRSPIAARFSSRCSAGPTIIRSSSSRGSGTSSTMTRQLSGGQTHLRNVKVVELKYRDDGTIETIDAYRD